MINNIRKEIEEIPYELKRRLRIIEKGASAYLTINGKEFINLSSNNYLSLAMHPEVIEGAIEELRKNGAGAGSSRLILGTSPSVMQLESMISELKRTESSIVTSSGYAAALCAITSLAGKNDGIVIEKSSHSCLINGARLSGAKTIVFRKNNLETLNRALKRLRDSSRRILVIMDGVHSMDGDIADLPAVIRIAEKYDAFLLIDDAHGTGTLGPNGEGIFAHYNLIPQDYVIVMGTLSKALGSQGGFLSASRCIIELFIQKGASFIYTTGLNPAAVGASIAAIKIMKKEPERIKRLRKNVSALCRYLNLQESKTPILPIILGEEKKVIDASKRLEDSGCLALPIRPPTVPKGRSRIRLSLQSDHRIFIEASDHSTHQRYLIALRSCSAEKISNPS